MCLCVCVCVCVFLSFLSLYLLSISVFIFKWKMCMYVCLCVAVDTFIVLYLYRYCYVSNNNSNMNNDHIERYSLRFLQSPLCIVNCFQHICSRGQGAIMCKSNTPTDQVLLMCNMLCDHCSTFSLLSLYYGPYTALLSCFVGFFNIFFWVC